MTLCQERREVFVQCSRPISFGVDTDTIYAIIFQELDQFAGIFKVTASVFGAKLSEELSGLTAFGYRSSPVYEVETSCFYTIFVSYVIECTRYTEPGVRPVTMDVDVLPHIEVVCFKIVTGKWPPLFGHFTDRSPPAKIFVVYICKIFISFCFIVPETFFQGNT